MMEDDGGIDEKILGVPVDKMIPYYTDVKEYTDLPKILIDQLQHFFERYKDLEKGKWVKVKGWEGSATAARLIEEGILRASKA